MEKAETGFPEYAFGMNFEPFPLDFPIFSIFYKGAHGSGICCGEKLSGSP